VPNTLSEKQKWQKNLKQDELKYILTKNDPTNPEDHGWIHITLRDNKLNYKVSKARRIVLVGCGSYPYSLFDIAKKYSHNKDLIFIGIDYDEICYRICVSLRNKYNLQNFYFYQCRGIDFNYSNLIDEDMIFLSADLIDIEDTYWHIIKNSKAQVYICKPHKKSPGFYPGD